MLNLLKDRPLFVTGAFFTLLLGIAWMAFPSQLLAAWGIEGGAAPAYIARRYAALFFGYALILWMARDEPRSRGRQAILAGSLVSAVLMAGMSLYGILSAAINAFGWMAFGLETLLTAGFGAVLFKDMAATRN